MSLQRGALFAGYTVERLLGAGENAQVYLARHPRLPRYETLKILHPELSADTAYRNEFNRAADLAAALWHPHIVAVHDHGEHEGRLWIAMDYVDGADAAALLRDHYPVGMPAHEAVAIVTAVAEALDYAHHRGLLHRHVAPTNILISRPDAGSTTRIVLRDFGITRSSAEASAPTTTTLTLSGVNYRAPEQLLGQPVTGRADQYALAATAYQLLTGSTVFPGDNPVAVLGAHLSAAPPRPSHRRPDLESADLVFARALAKHPDERLVRCSDFAAALAAQLDTPHGSPARLGSPAPAMPFEPTGSAPTPEREHTAVGPTAPAIPIPPAPLPATPERTRTRVALSAVCVLAVVAALAGIGTWFAHKTAAQRAAADREAARLTGQHYLEALAAGDARTALSLGAQQPSTPQLLSDKALRAQLADTPITDVDAAIDPNQDGGARDTQRLVLTAKFGATPSKTTIRAHKDNGQWKLVTTTISATVDRPPNSDAAMKALAVSGISTDGAALLSVFPGPLHVTSTNPYLDITAQPTTPLLEALTDTNRPRIHPALALNDAGRQAIWTQIDSQALHCNNGGPRPPDCGPPKPLPPGMSAGDMPDPDTLKFLNIEKPPDLTYDLDANTMTVHVTGRVFYAAQAKYGGKLAPVHMTATADLLYDITKQPPKGLHN